jgi:isoleucyl-tRNA synthetase
LPLGKELEDIIADEVNLKEVVFTEGDSAIIDLDTNVTDELKLEGIAREVVRSIQTLRKKAEFNVEDRIKLYYATESPTLESVFVKMGEMICREVLAQVVMNQKVETECGEDVTVEGEKIWFGISRD